MVLTDFSQDVTMATADSIFSKMQEKLLTAAGVLDYDIPTLLERDALVCLLKAYSKEFEGDAYLWAKLYIDQFSSFNISEWDGKDSIYQIKYRAEGIVYRIIDSKSMWERYGEKMSFYCLHLLTRDYKGTNRHEPSLFWVSEVSKISAERFFNNFWLEPTSLCAVTFDTESFSEDCLVGQTKVIQGEWGNKDFFVMIGLNKHNLVEDFDDAFNAGRMIDLKMQFKGEPFEL